MIEYGTRIRVSTSTTGQATNLDVGAAVSAAFLTPAQAGMLSGKPTTIVVEDGNDFQWARANYVTGTPNQLQITAMLGSKIGSTVELGSTATKLTLTGAASIRVYHAAEDIVAKPDFMIAEHNLMSTTAYQSKTMAEFRRSENLFATGFKGADAATDGINTSASSGYTRDSVGGKVSPTVTTGSGTSTGSPTGASNNSYTMLDRGWTVANSSTLTSIGGYSTSAQTMQLKLFKRNSSGNYDIVYSESFAHPGGGWADKTLATPQTIPASGTYHVGGYLASDAPYVSQSRSYYSGNATGSGVTFIEDTNNGPMWRASWTTGISNMTLVTGYQTADATVYKVNVFAEIDNTVAGVLGTDFSFEVTCNGGINWYTATVTAARGQNGRTIYKSELEAYCAVAGTSFGLRYKTLTNKSIPIYAAGMVVR